MRKVLFATISFALLLFSCSKETIYSYRLSGNWIISRIDVKEITNTVSSDYSLMNAGSYSFKSNNTGSVTTSAGTTVETRAFKWSAQSNKKVLLTFENQSIEEWIVSRNSSDKQVWESTSTSVLNQGGISVGDTLYKKMTLDKIK
ncbi:MAG: hypothetical protein ACKOXB_07605 [Flavobacteriales bacterium]